MNDRSPVATVLLIGLPAVLGGLIAVFAADRYEVPWVAYATLPIVVLLPLALAAGRGAARVPPSAPVTPREPAKPAPLPTPAPPPKPAGEDALVLLAALQREARLVDFLKEDLSGYDDAQVGAAVRDVHRDAAKVLDRVFAPAPAVDAEEGGPLDTATAPAERVRLIGNVSAGKSSGTVVHPGWAATKVNLPKRTGGGDVRVIAPAEVEV